MTTPSLTPEQQAMVDANLGLVRFAVGKWAQRDGSYTFDDAFQDGVFGLARAAQLFEPERGYRFSTYALPWIQQAMGRGRGFAEGVNYRRGAEGRASYEPPMSLDYEWTLLGGGGATVETGLSLVDVVADPEPLPDELAARRTDAQRMVGVVRGQCRSSLDVELVDELLADDRPHAQAFRELAARRGVTIDMVRRRWRDLRARTLEAVAA